MIFSTVCDTKPHLDQIPPSSPSILLQNLFFLSNPSSTTTSATIMPASFLFHPPDHQILSSSLVTPIIVRHCHLDHQPPPPSAPSTTIAITPIHPLPSVVPRRWPVCFHGNIVGLGVVRVVRYFKHVSTSLSILFFCFWLGHVPLGRTVSLDPKTRIVVPEDRYGLYAIDCLDPDLIVGSDCVCYFHDMIVEMLKWGFVEGKTLFGFGYDFRQSNRLPETMSRFAAKLESVYTASGGKKLNLITHSMGGLLVKCFMALHGDIFEKYVKNWIAIAAPFQGAPGYITTSLLNGMSFVEGWQQNFFISKWSMQQLLIECPSIYELMGCPNFDWNIIPRLEIWREKQNTDGNSTVMLEAYEPEETISIMREALSNNVVNVDGVNISVPLNTDILKWAYETKEILSRAKLPSNVKFYNIYGINCDTPHSLCYGTEQTPVADLKELLPFKAGYICVDGDGTVPVESAKADGLDAEARVAVHGDHRGIICDRQVFRILKTWLNAGHPDPFYNPLNDYVILPTAFEMESHQEEGMQITSLKEEWEIISEDQNIPTEKKPSVNSISVSRLGKDQSSQEEARATVVVHPQSDGMQHVELRAVSVSTSG